MDNIPPIVGHFNGEPIYSLPAIPEPINKGCEANPDYQCLPCILNEMVPIAKKLNESMERIYAQLMQIKDIRIDDGVTELHVKSVSEQLRKQLAVASVAHDTITQLLVIAKHNLT